MKPARFDYAAPRSTEEAVALLAEHGDEAKVIAGGQSLVPLLNLRLARPALLIDVNRVEGLAELRAGAEGVAAGACVRQRVLERSGEVAAAAPLLARAMPWVGHVATRARGTAVGSVVHADPASELPAVMLALGGELVVRSSRGERTIPAAELFTTQFTTAVADDELATEVRFPAHADSATGFVELARRHGDFAIVGAAVCIPPDAGEVAIALCGTADTPVRVAEAERLVAGSEITPGLLDEVAAATSAAVDPSGSVHGSAEYTKRMAGVIASRAVAQAAGIDERGDASA